MRDQARLRVNARLAPARTSSMVDLREHIERYLDEHAIRIPEWHDLPTAPDSLRASAVIPAYDEWPGLTHVLQSLQRSVARAGIEADDFEVIVVVNNATDAPPEIQRANLDTLEWLRSADFDFSCHPIDRASTDRAFPENRSGVGWARRIGMDLATYRLSTADHPHGFIPCLDGDSPPAPGYLAALFETFGASPGDAPLAGVCRYRHPLPADPAHREAISVYESWMRYFEAGLHLAGAPYAYQAIGSCMVISAAGYALADGVPTREALSDFYLLQKIVKSGGPGAVRHLRHATVYPSARPSLRVPRGTGPSVDQTMRERTVRFRQVEPPQTFHDLRQFFDAIPAGFDDLSALERATTPLLETFLDRWDSWSTLDKLRTHAPDAERFRRSVFEWFDALKMVQFAHDCRDALGGVDAFEATHRLADMLELDALGTDARRAAHAQTDRWTELLAAWRRHEWSVRQSSRAPTEPRSG